MATAAGPEERLRTLMDAVALRLRGVPSPDPQLRAAAMRLSGAAAGVAEVADRVGLSERQLRRRFERGVGYSPRMLARILRLQRFLLLAGRGHGLARLAADAGYADQPHLTRECTRLAGRAPRALLTAGAGPAGERITEA